MDIDAYKVDFEKRDKGACISAHLIWSRNKEDNLKEKGFRGRERECYLGMSLRSIIIMLLELMPR